MTATLGGLSVPLYPDSVSGGIEMVAQGSAGAFDILTITQSTGHTGDFLVLEDGDGSTELIVIEEDGVTNWALTSPGADNCLAVVVSDSSTVTSGYLQGVYVSMTLTSDANYSTGSSQINAFATDLALDGTVACEAEGMYIYVYSASAPTLTSANVSGLVINMADLKAAPSSRSGIQIHIEDGNNASGQDAGILVRMEGSSSSLTNLFELYVPAYITYFLKTNQGATSGKMLQTKTCAGTQNLVLVCNINGSTYWIPMYAASD